MRREPPRSRLARSAGKCARGGTRHRARLPLRLARERSGAARERHRHRHIGERRRGIQPAGDARAVARPHRPRHSERSSRSGAPERGFEPPPASDRQHRSAAAHEEPCDSAPIRHPGDPGLSGHANPSRVLLREARRIDTGGQA